MRIAIVHDAIHAGSRPDERDALAQVRLVAETLSAAGHETRQLAVTQDLGALASTLRRLAPDLVFNLVESLAGCAQRIHWVPGLLEELGLPFTGASSESLFLTSHKLLAKRLLAQAGLPTPEWLDPRSPREPAAAGPWILKPLWEDASLGIDDGALVEAQGHSLRRRLAARAAALGCQLFAERFVEGREFNLSLLAKSDGLEVLPPAEIEFRDYPPHKPRIVGYAAKWEEGSFEYEHTPRRFDFPPRDGALLARLEALAQACAELFSLSDYARVDFRVDASGAPWILEVNANPCLSPDAGFLAAAARAQLGPAQVVERLAAAARQRASLRFR